MIRSFSVSIANGALAAFLACAALGCSADEGGLAPGERLVTGRVQLGGVDPTQRKALQVVALHAAPECDAGTVRVGDASEDGALAACAQFGRPFDPALQGGGVSGEPFRLVAPCDRSVNLLLQTIGTSQAQSLGEPLALFVYPDGLGGTTSLVPREADCRDTQRLATNVLDLGATPFVPTESGPAELLIGGPDSGLNPLATIDTDQDLTPNASDDDDDGDGTLDGEDTDADGDGAADVSQRFDVTWIGLAGVE